ncbi:hypothetical protein GCM10027570_22180 [Streptomonospora sediminis]
MESPARTGRTARPEQPVAREAPGGSASVCDIEPGPAGYDPGDRNVTEIMNWVGSHG